MKTRDSRTHAGRNKFVPFQLAWTRCPQSNGNSLKGLSTSSSQPPSDASAVLLEGPGIEPDPGPLSSECTLNWFESPELRRGLQSIASTGRTNNTQQASVEIPTLDTTGNRDILKNLSTRTGLSIDLVRVLLR